MPSTESVAIGGSSEDDLVAGGFPGDRLMPGTAAGADEECGRMGIDALWESGGEGGLYASISRRRERSRSHI